jgi:CRP-like cAMP-binding protein
MSLIRDMPRSASVEAITDCLVIIITRPVLKEKLDKSDATVRAILAMMIKRVQSGNDSLANKRPTLEDLQENLVLLYEEVMSTLPTDRKPFFRDEMLPLIEDITDRMKKFKV